MPQEESDPRVEFEANFYYSQEDLVWEYCKATGCGWNICMPGPILGKSSRIDGRRYCRMLLVTIQQAQNVSTARSPLMSAGIAEWYETMLTAEQVRFQTPQ